ncbi:phosphoenolpyruvate synthase [Paenibacillus naphthalenovorans]|uniref:phosphoenolpyruvate synthase n=1 Tax=Paenibacillus naphthalenovorans TaxID=162209 RepID=UPI003D2BE8F2
MPTIYVLNFQSIDKSHLPAVGGKGANLGELTRAGFPVPQGFCVTTAAYRQFIQSSREMKELFDQLDRVSHEQLEQIRILGQRIREHLTSLSMPNSVKSAISKAWETTGKAQAYAVRSSATAEDLPTASFAGQQDTYLNVCGLEQLLNAVQNCWASLFTDRAISYRAKNGFNHRSVFISVVVQHMIFPEVSGIMFTADPVTGHRGTVSIDASFGLGEALVSGLVTADLYQVRAGEIVKKQVSKKETAIYAVPEGGTVAQHLPPEKQQLQALTDHQIIQLAILGKKIEAHYASEQDVEWGFADGQFYILQSRPITSLYPVPPVSDNQLHVFINFGYIQMMTDPMKPLAISVLSRLLHFIKKNPASSEPYILHHAGGRMFADFTAPLSIRPVRNRMLKIFKGMDESIASALEEVMSREAFRHRSIPIGTILRTVSKLAPIIIPLALKVINHRFVQDPAKANRKASALIDRITRETGIHVFSASGADRIRAIRKSIEKMPKVIPRVAVYFIAGVLASGTLKKKLYKRVGKERTDRLLNPLYKSLPGNVTTEFGLALGDLADKIRKYPGLIDYLQKASSDHFDEKLGEIPGGDEFKLELESFLQKYGMRCVGEIDITRPRWREEPTQLIPSIISNIRTATAGEHRKKFRQGRLEAEAAGKEIAAHFGFWQKRSISRLIKLYRHLLGMREHHKFCVVKLFDIYKRAMMEEANGLVAKGVLRHKDDVYYLTLEELIALLENRFSGDVPTIVEAREKQHEQNQKLKSPRVMTSEGEIISGKLRDVVEAPEGAIVGTPVSAGIVEGVARVVLKPEEAKLNAGEILVAPYTDPGWTPLFTSVVGLITEVGGLMTHGSVIAREYGIPAVVGIEKATERIKDGAYIRLNGTSGYVQILEGTDFE